MKFKYIAWFIFFISIILGCFIYSFLERPEVHLKQDLTAEINTDHTILEYVKDVASGKIITKDKKLDTTKLGNVQVTVITENQLKRKHEFTYEILVKDTTPPKITYTKEIAITEGNKVDLLKGVQVTDNSNEQITPTISGDYKIDVPGKYTLKYLAEDSSGNKTEEEFTLTVNKKVIVKQQTTTKPTAKDNFSLKAETGYPYYIRVNKTHNVVMVYGVENGEYKKLVKVFTVSAGNPTPTGTFRTSNKYVWKLLVGNVWGQYSTRITGQVLFHSVPYLKQTKDSLEYWEYNKLGTHRSLGCIRLTVIDAKWLYDNCPSGTKVEIFNGPLTVTKPATPKIDTSNIQKRGWDPTDPDGNNPWRAN